MWKEGDAKRVKGRWRVVGEGVGKEEKEWKEKEMEDLDD